MKNVKLTPAQAYALQVKADRKAAARERQSVTIASENARVNALFTETTSTSKTKMSNEKIIIFKVDELEKLPTKQFQMAVETMGLWEATYPEIEFPGVIYAEDLRNGKMTYWLNGFGLNASLPAMFTNNNRLTQEGHIHTPPADAKGYKYRSPALSTVRNRLRRGAPVFNFA